MRHRPSSCPSVLRREKCALFFLYTRNTSAMEYRVDSAGGDLHMSPRNPSDYLPDIRDGLTHRERIVLQCLYDLQQERGGRNVPTGMLYGTVVEHVDMSVEEMQSILVRLIGDKRLLS